ncbi:MAG: Na+/H+ antiporter NhaA [Proteobacteria bacterium]|nr:Na+/H+ antiporter NhaA [Pseudomonadota bacterium]
MGPLEPSRAQQIAERAFATLEKFLHVEAVSGVVLLMAAAAALFWANSPFAQSYHAVWHAPLLIGIGERLISQPVHFWINDALMTVFFLVVGMEIRREIHEGALSNPRQALLPIAAALGGVKVPALIYLAINHSAGQLQGWAVPTATDIAFAVGVLALLGRSIPSSLRIFLLTLAIIDDLIAVLIIAIFYSGGLQYGGFLVAGVGCLLVLAFQRVGVGSAWAYVLPGAVVWGGLLMTGAHPTLAGVALGLLTPVASGHLRGYSPDSAPPVVKVQSALHPWVAYGVMPVFALANAGVTLGNNSTPSGTQWITWGVASALIVGKPLGVVFSSWIAVRLGWCRLPPGLSWGGVWLAGLLAGIGFTMSIFIATLAFTDEGAIESAKLGVLLGSFGSALLALCWGWCLRVKSSGSAAA